MSWIADAEVKTATDLDRERKDSLISQIESQRKEQEAQGVIINGVRYAGYPGNRQAMKEALDMATDAGLTVFASWKDSDDQFHADHPVQDVWDAMRAIGMRRSELIGLEGQYIEDVEANILTNTSSLNWAT